MKEPVWEKRMPTLLGILFIMIGIIITSYLVKSGASLISRASPSHAPENIRITNISSTSFSVSYITKQAVTGVVSFGKDETLGQTVFDDRDQKSGTPSTYQTHHITIKNLTPNTQYFFSITSGEDSFLNNKAPFEVKTASVIIQEPPTQQPLSGKIVLPDGGIPSEALIYATSTNAQQLSTIIKDNGRYILPLNSMLSSNLSSYMALSENTRITILVSTDSFSSTVSLFPTQIDPVPVIILSQNYDFTQGSVPSLPDDVASESAQIGFPSFSASVQSAKEPEIIAPKEDEKFTDQKPLFKGTTNPSTDVSITINSKNIIETVVQADKKGNWTYRPDQPLSPGDHTVSITTRDKFGVLKKITKTFTVYAAGTQIEGAVPSGTPSQTPIPTFVITKPPSLPTSTPTPVPTIKPSPTPPPAGGPTPTIVPIPQVPPPGNSTTTILGIIAFGTITTGLLLLFLAKRTAFL